MKGKALNQMLDIDIKDFIKKCVAGLAVDLGKSMKREDVEIIADRVLVGLKYKQAVMNVTTDVVEGVFMRAALGEYVSARGIVDSPTPANIVRWIVAAYQQHVQDVDAARRDAARRSFNGMCSEVVSKTQKHPVCRAAKWLIEHSNDAHLAELQRSGLTREMIYQLAYQNFDLDRMFVVSKYRNEYVAYKDGFRDDMSSTLKDIIHRNDKFETCFLYENYTAVFDRDFVIPTSKEEIEKLDRRYEKNFR